MSSPFPGMDPYLESRWSDVHLGLIAGIRAALQPLLPPDLRARGEERVLLHALDGEPRIAYRSDVAVVRTGPESGAGRVRSGPATVEPVLVEIQTAPEVDRCVQIVDVRSGNRVITAVEVLSPGNKRPGRLNEDYLRKLEDYVRAKVNAVEIDLLRSSRGRLEVGPQDLPEDRRAPYLACLRRATHPGRWEIYPMPLRDALPLVPVPLRAGEPDVLLDLQSVIDRVYAEGGHDDIDYAVPPEPPLDEPDRGWASELLRAARGP